MNNILIIEDEEKVACVLKAYLEKEGYKVYCAANGTDGLKLFDSNKFSLVILDLMLPDIQGEEICRIIRNKFDVYIDMLTAKSALEDRIEGLNIGADEYLIKPFSPRELTARVNFKLSINKGIAASIIFTLCIVIILSLYFSKQFSVPISEVSDISVKLSKGDYSPRTDVDTDILELENLKNSINTLGEKLKQQDILRRRLVSDISHEIRTPLNILENNLEAMIDGIFPTNTEQLTALNDEVIRFGKLLNNLNVLKEFESESVILNEEKVSLKEVISSVCDDFLLVSNEKNIEIIYNVKPNENYTILGNRDKLKQVFINILSNAVKFTNRDGKIWVNLTTNKNEIVVSIRDNGIGISKEDLPFIFERLYRGDKSRNKIEGSGIGLTIVKSILELHSATINVESEINKGSKFTIRFKLYMKRV